MKKNVKLIGKKWTVESGDRGRTWVTDAISATTYFTDDGKTYWSQFGGKRETDSIPAGVKSIVRGFIRRRSKRPARRNAGSFSRRIRPAKSVAKRLKIYGGARLKKYGSKIVKRNSGCGCRRSR